VGVPSSAIREVEVASFVRDSSRSYAKIMLLQYRLCHQFFLREYDPDGNARGPGANAGFEFFELLCVFVADRGADGQGAAKE
jgi:hypothetical protein